MPEFISFQPHPGLGRLSKVGWEVAGSQLYRLDA